MNIIGNSVLMFSSSKRRDFSVDGDEEAWRVERKTFLVFKFFLCVHILVILVLDKVFFNFYFSRHVFSSVYFIIQVLGREEKRFRIFFKKRLYNWKQNEYFKNLNPQI